MQSSVIVVTGATGFVGRHLVAELLRQHHEVRLATRSPVWHPATEGIATLSCTSDFEPEALYWTMHGADAVVHLAGRAHVLDERSADPLTEFRAANVGLTRRVVEASIAAGVPRLVFFSSVGAVATTASTPITEEVNPAPSTPYGQSKLEAEQLIRELAGGSDLSCAMLRPPMIYGPEMKGNPLLLLGLIDRGLPLPFSLVSNRRSAAYVGNVVDATIRLLHDRRRGVEAYHVKDEEDLSLPELIRVMAGALRRQPSLFAVPPGLLRLGAAAGDLLPERIRRRSLRDVVDRLTESLVLDASKLERHTGFRPRYTAVEAWERTAAWYRGRLA